MLNARILCLTYLSISSADAPGSTTEQEFSSIIFAKAFVPVFLSPKIFTDLGFISILRINLYIPSSPQHPKFVVIDDPEIVGDLIAEGFPFVGEGFSKEPQDRIRELLLRWVVVIMSDVLVHDRP